MNASDIFTPITQYQLERGLKTTTRQISEMTGISENRIRQIRNHPESAKVYELEALTREYRFSITI